LRTKYFSTRWITIWWDMNTLDDQPY
jgi:hypothetical protein